MRRLHYDAIIMLYAKVRSECRIIFADAAARLGMRNGPGQRTARRLYSHFYVPLGARARGGDARLLLSSYLVRGSAASIREAQPARSSRASASSLAYRHMWHDSMTFLYYGHISMAARSHD